MANDERGEPATTRDWSETLFLPKTDFPMRAGLPELEPRLLARWETLGLYRRLREASQGRAKFVLHDGPPYANGHIHIGTALNKIIKDLVVRSQQMLGHDSPYVPGWDCHGLPIEWKIEEEYRAKGKSKDAIPINEFRDECRRFAAKWLDVQREEFKRLGGIGDWAHPYSTMDFRAEATIARELMKFAETGQLYRGSKPVMWSVVEQTALAEAEVEYQDYTSDQIWVKFRIAAEQRGRFPQRTAVLIWTTTPWTLPGNRAISFSSKIDYGIFEVKEAPEGNWARVGDRFLLAVKLAEQTMQTAKVARFERMDDASDRVALKLEGLLCQHPLHGSGYTFRVPLLEGDHVTDDVGTGFVHTAPGHGTDDYNIWMANRAALEGRGIDATIPFAVDADGVFTEEAPGFTGKRVLKPNGDKGDANEAVIQALVAANALVARGRLKHQYPHSWRSKKPVIFRNTPQWFIAMDKPLVSSPGARKVAQPAEELSTGPLPLAGRVRVRGIPTSDVQDSPPPNLPRKAGGIASREGLSSPQSGEASERALPVPPPLRWGLGAGAPAAGLGGERPLAPSVGRVEGERTREQDPPSMGDVESRWVSQEGSSQPTTPPPEPILRDLALAAIAETQWVPPTGENRIRGMIENRPDWVVSRQRAWGVPITVFRNPETEAVIPGPGFAESAELIARIEEAFAERGADVWFEEGARARFLDGLVENPDQWEQVVDVLDVWFDSGSTHAFTLEDPERFPDLAGVRSAKDGGRDQVMYLEGSDQHRGWFQSSLLESCGTRGRAPFDIVLTHGFVLDEKGEEKMAKSKGNALSPVEVMKTHGADILRLWVASADTTNDIRFGPAILQGNAEAYRKLRNTLRWMLGALSHYRPDEDEVFGEGLPSLERFMLHRLTEIDAEVREAYRIYDFAKVVAALSQFMNTDLSAFYFDVRKDALYCEPYSSLKRKSALTVIDAIFGLVTRCLAPILCFTAEEAWLVRHPSETGSVHLEPFADLPRNWRDAALAEQWDKIRAVRHVVTGALEIERAAKRIGSSLEAEPHIYVGDKDLRAALKDIDLAEVCITSAAKLVAKKAPKNAFTLPDVPGVGVVVKLADGKKCARSWRITTDVGSDPDFPDLSARDAAAVREFDARHGKA